MKSKQTNQTCTCKNRKMVLFIRQFPFSAFMRSNTKIRNDTRFIYDIALQSVKRNKSDLEEQVTPRHKIPLENKCDHRKLASA